MMTSGRNQTLFQDYWKLSKNWKLLWLFYQSSKMTPTAEFRVRRRALEPRYCNSKSSNIRPGRLALKMFFLKNFIFIVKVTAPVQFSWKIISLLKIYRLNSIFKTSAILELVIHDYATYGYISDQNFIWNSVL